MSDLLPPALTLEEFRAAIADRPRMETAVRQIAAQLNLPEGPLTHYPAGDVVYQQGDFFIKLTSARYLQTHDAERLMLAAIPQGFSLPTPELLASGELEGWPWMVLRALPGVTARRVWPQLSLDERVSVCAKVGAGIAELHALGPMAGLNPDWDGFVSTQREAAARRLARQELDHLLVLDAIRFLERWEPPPAALTRLHADLHYENLLLEKRGGHWQVSGLIDFGDAILGHPQFELATPLNLLANTPAEVRALYQSCGAPYAPMDWMAWTLLHPFAQLGAYFKARNLKKLSSWESIALAFWPEP